MTRKQKITLLSIFATVIVIFGLVAVFLNQRTTQEGKKEFKVEVVSERDNYSKTKEAKSEEEYLGQYLRTLDGCEWTESEYGIYISAVDGIKENIDNQYWWCVSVNGESSIVGADEIPLQDGNTYTLTLMQGW